MANLRPFQIFLLAAFVVLAIVAIVLLNGFSSSNSEGEKAYGERVLVWGTLDASVFDSTISELETNDEGLRVVDYVQIDPRTFNDEFLNAVAEGRSPDLILLPSSEFVQNRSKLLALSYETVPLRDFKNTYIDGAEIFARPDGVYALPLGVDPVVMYWNRDLFANNGLAQAPTTWESIVSTAVPTLTRRDNNRNITQSALAFGEVRNIQNAKEIMLLLTLQSGSGMIIEDQGRYLVQLNQSLGGNGLPPFEVSVQFFTNFSNSNTQLYSWNRSRPLDRSAFISGDLAMYFGYGSEVDIIQGQNPNLNFDMADVPQGASATINRTYGEFYGFAIPKASQNTQGAFRLASLLTRPDIAAVITEGLGIAPAQRSAVAAGSGGLFRQIILSSALVARAWLDPDQVQSDLIFREMIEDVTSGRKSFSQAASDAIQKISLAF
ncbi:extracellular solute-binding protein [Candidatus Pacebacteria bacterium]|nr:extracellular solute-binding protein [Candidatus Paceibacterota bacterium]